jgi:hypothetical protein
MLGEATFRSLVAQHTIAESAKSVFALLDQFEAEGKPDEPLSAPTGGD